MGVKRILKAVEKLIADEDYRFYIMSCYGFFKNMSDEEYLKRKFKGTIGTRLDLDNPRTFNEKLQWLKLYDRRPEYTMMVDKYLVRQYIAETIGEEYLIPLLGVWNDPDEIDFNALPEQFVLKCNHNSGTGMCICKDKKTLNIEKVKKELRKGLAQNYYLTSREWPYRDVPRKIICEKYMTDKGQELADYKIHNFDGVPRFILVCKDRFEKSGLTEDFFTPGWEHMPIRRLEHPNASSDICKPKELEEMLRISKILSDGYPFIRTDFYTVNNKIYFGELTLYPASGFTPFDPDLYDDLFGSWVKLPIEGG